MREGVGECSRGVVAAAFLFLALAAPARGGDWKFNKDLSISNKPAEFHIDLKGYVQWDFRNFGSQFDNVDPLLLNPTSELPRRLRIGVEGEWKKLGFEIDFDPHDTCWIFEDPCIGLPEHLKNAFLEYHFSKGVNLRAGNMKLPISNELLTSEGKVDLIERAMAPSRLGPGRDWGLEIYGTFHKKQLTYMLGVFEGDGRAAIESAGTTGAARLAYAPVKGLELAASLTRGDVTAEPESANNFSPEALGPNGKGPSGYNFFPRKFVNGHRTRYGFDGAFVRGPFGLKAEYIENREQRLGQGSTCHPSGSLVVCNDLPDVYGRGWYGTATWLVTGDKKTRTIKPKRPLFNGIGAVELALRYENLHFDDAGPNTGFAGAGNRASNIRPAGDRVLTAGVSWWPTQWARVVGNASWEHFEDALTAPISGTPGGYVTLVGRLQLLVP